MDAAGRVLEVRVVPTGELIATIELTEGGELVASTRGTQGMVDTIARNRGWTGRQAFERLGGWSNGYLRIMRLDPRRPGRE